MQQFNFPNGIKILPGYSYERAAAFVAPPELIVELVGPQVTAIDVLVTATLTNPSDAEVLVIGFPCGAGPWCAQVVTSAAIDHWRNDDPARPPTLPPMPPAAPPPPMEFLVPPQSCISFTTRVGLERYRYSGAPEIEIEWHFAYWNDPKPRGRLKVQLPQR